MNSNWLRISSRDRAVPYARLTMDRIPATYFTGFAAALVPLLFGAGRIKLVTSRFFWPIFPGGAQEFWGQNTSSPGAAQSQP